MKNHLLKLGVLSILVMSLTGCGNTSTSYDDYPTYDDLDTDPVVKMSVNSICHRKGSTYYSKTLNFTPYDSMDDCLDDGGRRPKR